MLVTMVCWGNICRSPMAEVVARAFALKTDCIAFPVHVNSVGVSSEETGNPIDPRAAAALEARGYAPAHHRARQVTREDISTADLFVAAEAFHLEHLRSLGAQSNQLALITDFDPDASGGDPLPDPWYGDAEGFDATLDVIERAIPNLFAAISRERDSK